MTEFIDQQRERGDAVQQPRSEAGLRSAMAGLEEANATHQRALGLRERLTQSVTRSRAKAQILA